MKNTLSQRIQARLERMKGNPRNKNRADFLANKEEIFEAMADNWSMKVIWETLREEGKINFSYQAFTEHVKKHKATTITKPLKAVENKPKPSKVLPPNNPVVATAEQQTTFNMNTTPDKDSLL